MTQHTEGKLTVGGQEHDDWGIIRGGDGKPLATTFMQCRVPEPQSQWIMTDGPPEIVANARRLVASWNAMLPHPIEEVEACADLALKLVERHNAAIDVLEDLQGALMLAEATHTFPTDEYNRLMGRIANVLALFNKGLS